MFGVLEKGKCVSKRWEGEGEEGGRERGRWEEGGVRRLSNKLRSEEPVEGGENGKGAWKGWRSIRRREDVKQGEREEGEKRGRERGRTERSAGKVTRRL